MNTKTIGLSLGADLCWPAAYEELLRRLDPVANVNGTEWKFKCERVIVEPFDLEYKPKYDLVLDRVTHWHPISREWIKKIVLMDGVYVLNNPWAIQSMEKHTSYCAMMKLGIPGAQDLDDTLQGYPNRTSRHGGGGQPLQPPVLLEEGR